MPAQKLDAELAGQISGLRDGKIRYAEPGEILEVVQNIIDGMNDGAPSGNSVLRGEFEELADFIQATKAEIMMLAPEDIQDEHLPLAAGELDAIVRATEDATQNIMEATERLETLADGANGDTSEMVINATTQIYEACGFQDITGQRIGKVIGALKEVESKVEAIISAFGNDDQAARNERRRQRILEREQKTQQALETGECLEGPQLPDAASSQDNIDALFASLD